jgi:uncharacterized Zn-binding protein involved in type VI secretion
MLSSTTHEGTPVTSATKEKAKGSLKLRKTDVISCPIHGTTTITQGSSTVKAEGLAVAYDGCTTSCGATMINGATSVLIGA